MDKLKVYLAEHGLNANQFARQAGVAHTTILRIMAGQTPRIDTAERIRGATGGFVKLEDWVTLETTNGA